MSVNTHTVAPVPEHKYWRCSTFTRSWPSDIELQYMLRCTYYINNGNYNGCGCLDYFKKTMVGIHLHSTLDLLLPAANLPHTHTHTNILLRASTYYFQHSTPCFGFDNHTHMFPSALSLLPLPSGPAGVVCCAPHYCELWDYNNTHYPVCLLYIYYYSWNTCCKKSSDSECWWVQLSCVSSGYGLVYFCCCLNVGFRSKTQVCICPSVLQWAGFTSAGRMPLCIEHIKFWAEQCL